MLNISNVFSIIICAYNAENRIESAINSILNQKGYNDLVNKFFLVDNKSTDNTANIMKKYEAQYNNIEYIFEEKQGLSFARLAGVNACNSEWIMFVDDDNILQDNWLIKAYEYIKDTPNVGAFNGAVIPEIKDRLTIKEENVLKNVYPGLACTHLKEKDIDYSQKKHPATIPFGAGLVIRTSPLKKMAVAGWTKSTGRNGEKLSAGEDSEMCLYVQKEGYDFGYNPNMLIKHIISKNRLSYEYATKLYQGFAEYYIVLNKDNLKTKKFIILTILRYIKAKIGLVIFMKTEKKLKWFLKLSMIDKYIEAIKNG